MLALLPLATIGSNEVSNPILLVSYLKKAAASDSVLKSLKLLIAF